jgi:Protein of unknown function (DUF3833)
MPNDMSPATKAHQFDIAEFLNGDTTAWGVFEDRFGRVRRRFRVKISGGWTGDRFVMNEDFIYCDGETEQRTWTLQRSGPGRYLATTADCVGHALIQCDGTAAHMRYTFRLRLKNRTMAVTFDDRIYLIDQRSAMNRTVVSKWGVKLGEVTLFFSKPDSFGQRMAV